MMRHHVLFAAIATSAAALPAAAQNFKIERVATGFHQPTDVNIAPGETDTIYVVERTTPDASNPNALPGRIIKQNVTTGARTTFLDLSTTGGSISTDSGVLTMEFHPDYATVGTAGFGKFYVGSAVNDGTGIKNIVDEYTATNGVASFGSRRTVLKYNSNGGAVHTVDQLMFKPGAAGAARNYLYITTGDGGPQANSASYVNRAQDLNEVYGKVLRVDVGGGDAYPSDANKNFAIPSINNSSNKPSKLGEVIASGLRNPWRASFDRATGDIFIGDVGFNSVEEVNFIKSEWIANGTIVPDFGWAKREGIVQTPGAAAGIAGPKGDSLDPIIFRTDPQGDRSVTGGFVYRGPVAELQGKYVYADHIAQRFYTLNFDRNIDGAAFNGNNVTNFTDVTSLFDAAVEGGAAGLDMTYISSFMEDAAGNLYIVDFANQSGNEYQSRGEGEIYRLVAVPEPGSLALLAISAAGILSRRRRNA